MRFLLSLIFVVSLCHARAANYLGPEVGDVAPPLKIKQWLQRSGKTEEGWPAGKVVVLEFWSTWCAPCVASIPHLNELAEQLKDKPVQFISVTDQPKDAIQSFLKKTPIHGWIGLVDEVFGDGNPYRVDAIPHTVIIGTNGRIACVTEPRLLNSRLIDLCIAGRRLPDAGYFADAPPQEEVSKITEAMGQCPPIGVVPGQSSIGKTPIYQVLIRPETPVQWKKGEPQFFNYSSGDFGLSMPHGILKDAINAVFRFESTRSRLVLETKLPTNRYDFYVSLPPRNSRELRKKLETAFAQALEATFGLIVKREMRTVEALVLRTNSAGLGKLAADAIGDKAEGSDWHHITVKQESLTDLAARLENAAGQPVLDETGVTNRYYIRVEWDQKDFQHPNPKGMADAVRRLGLELTLETRQLEMVVVRAAPD